MVTGSEVQYDLFVSYAAADQAWVEGYLADGLAAAGVRWISEAAFALGAPRLAEFERAVQTSRRVLLILSPAYLTGDATTFVDLLAQSYGLTTATWPVVPLVLQEVKLPPRLAMLTALDATSEAAWPDVLARLCALAGQPLPPPPPLPPCPYPGMIPFGENDTRLFFGRDAEIAWMLRHFRQQRLLWVIGPSGSGKSSLVYAGLLPRLHTSSYWPAGTWRVVIMRPGAAPLEALARTLGGSGDPGALVAAQLAAAPPATRLLLVIDQFEEVFSLAPRAALAPFLAAVSALRACESCAILLTMRADFYPDLMNSDLWPIEPSQRLEVAGLRGDALRAAIQEPAKAAGVVLEAGLLDRLVADAADEPGVLPLLQETMVLLWAAMERRLLPLSAYTRLGSATRSGLAVAMAQKADATLAALPPGQQRIARRIFLRLVQFGQGRADTRRQQLVVDLQSTGDDPALFAATLRYLAENRLLTLGGDETRRTVDIAHEALIAGWPLLSGWLIERRDAEQTRRRLEAKAQEWVRLERGGGLLDEVELREAERWLAGPDADDLGYDSTLPALVAASQAALAEAQAREEAARRRELEQAQALAAAQQRRAEEQAATNRRLLLGAAGLVVLLLIAVALGVAALRFGQDAAQARAVAEGRLRVARAQALAALANEQLPVDPQRSLLLAMAAVSATRTLSEPVVPAAETALHAVLLHGAQRLRTLAQPATALSVAWSRDGQLLATTGRDGLVTIWNAGDGEQLRTLPGHDGLVNSVAWSSQHNLLLTAGDDGTARIWDATRGQAIRVLHVAGGKVLAAAWRADEGAVVTGSADGTVQVWDATTGTPGLKLQAHNGPVRGVDWSPGGQTIVSAGADGSAKIWDAATPAGGSPRATLCGHTDQVFSARFRPDGRTIVTAGLDGTARVWDTARLAPAGCTQAILVLVGHQGAVVDAVYRPDGQAIATVSQDGSAKIWDAVTGLMQITLPGFEQVVTGAAWSADGQRLATSAADGTCAIWDVAPGQERPTLRPGLDGAWTARYSPNLTSTEVVVASYTQTATLWDGESGALRAVLTGHTGRVNTAVFSRDGARVLTASDDGTARVWNATTGAELFALRGHSGGVVYAVDSPDGTRIATAGKDGTARLWDATNGAPGPVLRGHTGELVWVAWSPDSHTLITTSADHSARLWDASSGALRFSLQGHTGVVFGARFSPDGRRVATMGLDGMAMIWNVATGQEQATLRGHTGEVYSLEYSPQGDTLLTAGQDGTARLWDASTGALQWTLAGHTGPVFQAIYSPDGRRIVTVSQDKTVKIWDTATRQDPVTLEGATDLLISVAFRPDGSGIAVTSRDGTVRQYLIPIGDLLNLAQKRVTRGFTPEEQTTYQVH